MVEKCWNFTERSYDRNFTIGSGVRHCCTWREIVHGYRWYVYVVHVYSVYSVFLRRSRIGSVSFEFPSKREKNTRHDCVGPSHEFPAVRTRYGAIYIVYRIDEFDLRRFDDGTYHSTNNSTRSPIYLFAIFFFFFN